MTNKSKAFEKKLNAQKNENAKDVIDNEEVDFEVEEQGLSKSVVCGITSW